nr:MAG TPA: holin [Caudoviricetes sp.]
MENLMSYVVDNALILIPVLYVLGAILKGTEKVEDKYIPVVLLPVGIVLAMLIVGFNVNGFIQGILVTGATVYANQLIKQVNK